MDVNEVRESIPVGDLCRVNGTRSTPGVSTTILVSVQPSGGITKQYDLVMSKAIEMVALGTFTWVDHTASDIEDADEVALGFGFSKVMLDSLRSDKLSEYVDLETELGMRIPSVRVERPDPEIEPSYFLVKDNLILTIHGVAASHLVQFSRYADTYLKKMGPALTLSEKRTLFLIRLLDENCNDHFDQLRFIEDHADSVGGELSEMSIHVKDVGKRIFQVKHTTIVYLSTLWHLLDVINSLRFGDAELIDDNQKILGRLNLMSEDVARQVELSENMSEVLVSGMDVLQALYNNQLLVINNRMVLALTWMTVLGTALLVPNTLATIFSYVIGLDPPIMIWSVSVILMATALMSTLAYWWTKSWTVVPRSPDEYLA
ncbi:MAG TPA: CorA family divalent cation transporter [Methanomassiliicoccales archaeon]|jgi:magnesium transporter